VLQDTIHTAEGLVARDPGSKENRLTLGQTHVWMANCLSSSKDLEGALRQRHQAETILGQLAAEAPQDMKILDSQVWNLLKIGNLLAQQHDSEKTENYYDVAIQIAEPLAPRHPSFAERPTELRQAKEEVSHEGPTHKISR
jgi:hypothetical protein